MVAAIIAAVQFDRPLVELPWMVRTLPVMRLLPVPAFDRLAGLFGLTVAMDEFRGREATAAPSAGSRRPAAVGLTVRRSPASFGRRAGHGEPPRGSLTTYSPRVQPVVEPLEPAVELAVLGVAVCVCAGCRPTA